MAHWDWLSPKIRKTLPIEGAGKRKLARRHTRIMKNGRIVIAGIKGEVPKPPPLDRHPRSIMSRAKRGEIQAWPQARILMAGLPLPRRFRRSKVHDEILKLCKDAMKEAGLPWPPPPPEHPLPRRDRRVFEPRPNRTVHRTSHRNVYVRGCEHCQRREYAFFRRHPEKRPKGYERAPAGGGY